MTFLATKRPLNDGNGTPMPITATSSGTAQTIYVSDAAQEGWDEVSIYVTNSSGTARTFYYDIGQTGVFAQVSIPGNTSMYRLLPSGREALPFRGGITIKAYASNTGLQVLGAVVEVRRA